MATRSSTRIVGERAPDLARAARTDPDAARAALRALSPDEIAGRVLALDPGLRDPVLSLLERPEEVVPLLPEAELVRTVRATGLDDGGWLLAFATPEQRVACIDLDCWRGARLSLARVREWLDAMIRAGTPTVTAAFDDLDLELWVLTLKQMAEFSILGRGDVPPPGALTEDGVVYYTPHLESDARRLAEILRTAFTDAPRRYWQLVYGAVAESQAECEEYARRWHGVRLNDLGFPDRDQAMELYKPLVPEETPVVEIGATEPRQVVRAAHLPRPLANALLGRALAELPEGRAADVLGYVMAVGNAIAVADRLPFTDSAAIEKALRKAVRGIDLGLEALAKARHQSPGRVLDRTRPSDLFRVGATLDRSLRPHVTLADLDDLDEVIATWDLDAEVVEPEVIPAPRPR